MAQEPDRLRADIANTRASLTRDVDLLAEKTSPTKVAQRRWTAVKEKVMGTTDHARHAASDTTSSAVQSVQGKASQLGDAASSLGDTASEKAHDAAGAVKNAPRAVASQTQGNPIAAGVIAFGVGMLAASLLPVTDAERRAGQEIKDHTGDLAEGAKDLAQGVKEELGGTVQQAVGEVRSTAQDAVQTTKDQARSSAQDATEQTRQAARSN